MSQILDNICHTLRSKGRYWIAFTGDSITSCEWVHPNWRDIVIYVLQNEITTKLQGDWKLAEWGVRGFNFAYDGATTRDIVDKIEDIKSINPNLVIGLMGGNDPTFGISVFESISNIIHFCSQMETIGTEVVWCNSTPAGVGSPKNAEYEPYAVAFMESKNLDFITKIDMYNLYQEFPTEKFFTFVSEENPVEKIKSGDSDLQHPNQLGNAYIAKIILDRYFGIKFNPEIYISDTLSGQKLPDY